MPKQKMAIVIGAGIVGLATACRLAEQGFDVTVIEQRNEPGRGSSMANAGQLLYDYIGAMGSPAFLKNLPGTLINPDQGVVASALLHPKNWSWVSAFIKECTNKAWRTNTTNMIELAQRSRRAMAEFNTRHSMDFSWRKPGKLIVYQTPEALAGAADAATFKEQFGGKYQLFSKEKCIEYEPALSGATRPISGGVYLPEAEVGDCYAYCKRLAEILVKDLGGEIRFGVKVNRILREHGRATALQTSGETISGDLFVVTAGIGSQSILPNRFKGKQPITGIKGISLTYESGDCPPNLSVTDATGKFVILRLGNKIRVSGYAIFSDNLDIKNEHLRKLEDKAKSLMPAAADYGTRPEVWTGLRPQTPNDCPMIGQAGADNIYVNAGHGSTGWMLAFGSAAVLLDMTCPPKLPSL